MWSHTNIFLIISYLISSLIYLLASFSCVKYRLTSTAKWTFLARVLLSHISTRFCSHISISWICFQTHFCKLHLLLYNLNYIDNISLGRVVSMKTKSNALETFFKKWHLKSAIEVDADTSVNLLGEIKRLFKSKDSTLRLLCRALTLLFHSKHQLEDNDASVAQAGSLCPLWEELWAPHLISRSKMHAYVSKKKKPLRVYMNHLVYDSMLQPAFFQMNTMAVNKGTSSHTNPLTPKNYSLFARRWCHSFLHHFAFVYCLFSWQEFILFAVRHYVLLTKNNNFALMPREIQNYFAKNQYKEFLKEEKIYYWSHVTK